MNIQNIHQLKVLFCIMMLIGACNTDHSAQNKTISDYQPDRDLGELFVAVQTSGVFDDYKTFVDCFPKKDPAVILQDYKSQKSGKDFDLLEFVAHHFDPPSAIEKKPLDSTGDMITHLKNHWKYLTRTARTEEPYTTLISLPEPYIVPGGRFRELFYWDSYFSMIGLLESDEDELAYGMLKNFDFLIKKYGFIPNGNRTYFASRSQPPFFAEMLSLYSKKHGMDSVIEFLSSLEQEYKFWMDNMKKDKGYGRTVQIEGVILNRYNGTLTTPRAEGYGKEKKWAANLSEEKRAGYHRHLRAVCESGWDFSSRWFADGKNKMTTHCEDIVPVCLNSLLFNMEKQLAVMYKHADDQAKAMRYRQLADDRKQAITKYLWSEEQGAYKDYDFISKEHTSVLSLATLYPLYFGIANETQAERVATVVEKQLLFDGGVVTTTVHTGEQWDYPNGWAPLQWITVIGLAKYGHKDLAIDIAKRWLQLNEKVFRDEGKMMEKYNVVDTTLIGGGGAYKNQDGFGWTNGVALGLYAFLNEEKTEKNRQK